MPIIITFMIEVTGQSPIASFRTVTFSTCGSVCSELNHVWGSWFLIIWLKITAQSSGVEFWTVTFANWFYEVIVRNFVSGQSLSKISWLSNITKIPVAFKTRALHNTTHMLSLDLTPTLSFEPRFYMLIINVYYKKSKHLVIGLLFYFVLMKKLRTEIWEALSHLCFTKIIAFSFD